MRLRWALAIGFSTGSLLSLLAFAVNAVGYGTPLPLLVFSAPAGLSRHLFFILAAIPVLWLCFFGWAARARSNRSRAAFQFVMVVHYAAAAFEIWQFDSGESLRVVPANHWLVPVSYVVYSLVQVLLWRTFRASQRGGGSSGNAGFRGSM